MGVEFTRFIYVSITQGCTQELMDGVFLLSFPPLPSPIPFLSLSLEAGSPETSCGALRSTVISSSKVRGGALAENEFGAL